MYWIMREDHTLVPTDDVLVWGEFFEKMENRRVAEDVIEQPESDPVRVSTVFIGLDNSYFDVGPPLLFESMVFGGPLDGDQYRYPTWDSALEGHKMLLDEAVLEGKVAAWDARARIKAMAARARDLQRAAYALQMEAIEKARQG
jgi:hypothetical protein